LKYKIVTKLIILQISEYLCCHEVFNDKSQQNWSHFSFAWKCPSTLVVCGHLKYTLDGCTTPFLRLLALLVSKQDLEKP